MALRRPWHPHPGARRWLRGARVSPRARLGAACAPTATTGSPCSAPSRGSFRARACEVGDADAVGYKLPRVFRPPRLGQQTMIVAIDGPAGAGKSTVARRLAERLGFRYLDTGAMYRALTWLAMQRGPDARRTGDRSASSPRTNPVTFDDGGRVSIAGTDVTASIRESRIDRQVPVVARHPAVREVMRERQRELGEQGNVVIEGRDIGTVVAPSAEVKVYLNADHGVRARRRQAERPDIGGDALATDLRLRDESDAARMRPARTPSRSTRPTSRSTTSSRGSRSSCRRASQPRAMNRDAGRLADRPRRSSADSCARLRRCASTAAIASPRTVRLVLCFNHFSWLDPWALGSVVAAHGLLRRQAGGARHPSLGAVHPALRHVADSTRRVRPRGDSGHARGRRGAATRSACSRRGRGRKREPGEVQPRRGDDRAPGARARRLRRDPRVAGLALRQLPPGLDRLRRADATSAATPATRRATARPPRRSRRELRRLWEFLVTTHELGPAAGTRSRPP